MTRRVFLVGLLAPVATACAVKVRPSSVRPGYVQRGLASFYGDGDGYSGRRTASGARFDKNALTAAHFDLPFGTRIRVRNLNNGREVDLTVTDRFPPETLNKGRILDVSYGAAKKLRMLEDGVVPVELTVRA
jgi:peptidoglycan lytic transglycosylase